MPTTLKLTRCYWKGRKKPNSLPCAKPTVAKAGLPGIKAAKKDSPQNDCPLFGHTPFEIGSVSIFYLSIPPTGAYSPSLSFYLYRSPSAFCPPHTAVHLGVRRLRRGYSSGHIFKFACGHTAMHAWECHFYGVHPPPLAASCRKGGLFYTAFLGWQPCTRPTRCLLLHACAWQEARWPAWRRWNTLQHR